MDAVRLYGIGDLRFEEVPSPGEPTGGDVLVRVLAAGICGSDLHNYRTGQWLTRVPSIPGHEFAGEVLAVGSAAERLVPGDRVIADSRVWCGGCSACLSGMHNICERLGYVGEVCDGSFAERVILPEQLLHRIDPRIDPGVAAMAEPLAVALHAVARLRPDPGSPVLVLGCGPIGGLAALVLSRSHNGPLLLVDRNIRRRERVASVTGGIPVELDAGAIRSASGGAPLRFAIEATGSIAAASALLALAASGASLAFVGIAHGKLSLDLTGIVEREITMIGCSAFAGELPEAIRQVELLSDDLRRLIDRDIGLPEVPEAYDRLIRGDADGLKVIIRAA